MNSYHKNITMPICISLLILLSSSFALANTEEQPISDMRILIDVSGSMKQNDPNNLRAPALKLLVGLLPNNSRAGVWTFGKEVNMQVKLDDVSDAWKKYARKEAKKIHSFGLFTNIEDAISRATWDWKDPDPKYQRTLILLTDGVVDISKDAELNKASRQRIISQLLPKLSNADVKVNTIALSENADHKLLQKLATRTNGWYSSVSSANELKRKFLHLFEKSTQTDAIPLKDNSFTVDKSVSEMTVLIFKTDDSVPTELVTPDGKILTSESKSEGLQWHHESGYDMITISKPASGKWKAKAEIDPDNRVLVVTNLKLKSNKFTHNFLKGDIITIYTDLEEEKKIIKKQEFLKLVTFNLKINGRDNAYKLNDNGSIPDAKPQDGIFSSIIETAGLEESNDVLIEAKGATFHRQLRHSFKVFKSPFTIDVEEPVDERPFDFSVTIKPYLFVKNSVNIHIELPDGKTLTAKPTVNQRWRASIPTIYQGNNIQVSLKGKRYSQSEPYQYSESYVLPSTVKEEVVTEEPEKVMEQPPVILEKDMPVKEEQTPPKEIAPPPPPVTEKKTEEPPVKKEEKQVAKTEPVIPEPEKLVEPEPEKEANWFVVFLIVLVGNGIIIAGAYYGYLFWKKKRNTILAEDNAVLEEDDTETVSDNQAQPTENESEDNAQTTSPIETGSEEVGDAIADEPKADTPKHEDADPLISNEDEDILKQQLGIEEETDEQQDGSVEEIAEPPLSDEDILKQQLGITEESNEEQQTPVDETPEETPASESIEELGKPELEDDDTDSLLSDKDEDILKQQLGIEDEAEETTNTESTSEPQDNSVETGAEAPEEIIELDSPEVINETESTESPAERDENPESESDIEIDNGPDKSQEGLEEEAILSDLDFEIDNMNESDESELDDSQKIEPAKDAKK